MVELRSAEQKNSSRISLGELFTIFAITALLAGLAFQYFGIFRRFELQTINHRFEFRQWSKWSFNPADNRPKPALKFVIFNRMPEDEPAEETVKSHAWMKPLLSYPLSRECLSEMVNFLAASGARAIVLDFDFPQYTPGDKDLARAIYKTRSNIKAMPVFIANTVHPFTAGNVSEIQYPITRSGVIRELEELEPGNDVVEKYTGLTGVLQDEDQVVRRLALKRRMQDGKEYEALITKLLRDLDVTISPDTPEVIDIDFISGPNSDLFPVRPLSHLLDPDHKTKIINGSDASLKDAIVLIGDGISDVYDTPLIISGADRRSGAELLAQGIDTLARKSWLYRITVPQEYIYIAFMAIFGALNFVVFRYLSSPRGDAAHKKRDGLAVGTDVSLFVSSLLSVYIFANVLFSYANVIVPLVVPGIAITLATLVTVLWERDRVRLNSMTEQIQSSQEKLVLAQEKHEAHLAYQASLADQRAMEEDRSRRHEMVRRLNHDLKAPVSVFNWTVAKVLKDRTEDDPMYAVFQRLKRSSEHLSNLLGEIVQSLGEDQSPDGQKTQICEITSVLIEQAELEKSLAEITGSDVVLTLPDAGDLIWVVGTELEVARIVDNIVGNALKHNPAGTKIEISMSGGEWDDEDVVVSIKDNGKGIGKDDLERIFQTGYRVAGTRQEGQGLGLSIAITLVSKIGGKLGVVSDLGIGTRFDITLQRYKSQLDATSDIRLESIGFASPSEKLAASAELKKLVIDDWAGNSETGGSDGGKGKTDSKAK